MNGSMGVILQFQALHKMTLKPGDVLFLDEETGMVTTRATYHAIGVVVRAQKPKRRKSRVWLAVLPQRVESMVERP